ncbi:recombinase family protein [Agrobacterium rubi]|uniref:recombinase family protein n=1 Tax=Agrobacterium rubi TaxID=28099 RepID=UPI0015730395|nr:recombinase family protein [Agrobacterium rubi]NTF06845.1 recombinase family protein [Agrobacterium rubi]NTF19087.1 recombinase family protein [Agrobacterium rubi]NTF26050.1 recombinase family protein [Agrobacterium rubi]
MTKYVAYYRVSTVRQGASGLGLDAQRSSVLAFTNAPNIIAEYTEVESGKRNDRPALAKALAHAKAEGATLLIAKVDRLARNNAFVANLLEAGVEIKCADMPEANRMLLQMMSVIAEHEARMISERTKAALKAAKDRGQTLGGFKWDKASFVEHRQAIGQASADRAFIDIQSIPGYEALSFNALAKRLNDQGFKTTRGSTYTAMQVKRVIDRMATHKPA